MEMEELKAAATSTEFRGFDSSTAAAEEEAQP